MGEALVQGRWMAGGGEGFFGAKTGTHRTLRECTQGGETQRAQRKDGEGLRLNTEDTENPQRGQSKTRTTKCNGDTKPSKFAGHGMPCPYENLAGIEAARFILLCRSKTGPE